MYWSDFLSYFTIGAAAAVALEFLKLFELKGKLPKSKYMAVKVSWEFWISLLGFAAASGFFAWMFNAGATPPETPMKVGISAIAARSLLRNVLEALNANRPRTMGDKVNESHVSFQDILS